MADNVEDSFGLVDDCSWLFLSKPFVAFSGPSFAKIPTNSLSMRKPLSPGLAVYNPPSTKTLSDNTLIDHLQPNHTPSLLKPLGGLFIFALMIGSECQN